MKRSLLAIVLSFSFSMVVFADYKIEVCRVPIGRLIGFNIADVQHVFVRGTAQENITALNFGPVNLHLVQVGLGEAVPADVTNKNYDDAICATVSAPDDDFAYMLSWSTIVDVYEKAARETNYQLYNVGGKNCSKVAEEAVCAAGFEFPFPNINGQDHMADFLYDVGRVGRNARPENVARAVGSAAGVIRGLFSNKRW